MQDRQRQVPGPVRHSKLEREKAVPAEAADLYESVRAQYSAAQRLLFHPAQRIIVLFDDVSLDPGRLRVRADGSAGGHNGIKSIIAELGSQDFPRVKIGVGIKPHPEMDLADWVLSNFSASEEKALCEALPHAAEAALCIIEHGIPETANRFNGFRP